MTDQTRTAGWFGVSCVLLLTIASVANADQIRMKDGTEVSARILQRSGESVIVEVPRAAIETVNGVTLPPPVIAGAVAPAFEATDLSGATHALAKYRGSVTLLQFWASWCPHCRSDMPLMKKLFSEYQSKGLQVVTVSIDVDVNSLQTFIHAEALPYPVISATAEPELTELYEMQGVPAYFLIDATGKIAKAWRGSITESSGDLEQILQGLLKPQGT